MARVTTTKYVCDSCETEVERKRDLSHFIVVNHGRGGRDSWSGTTKMELCDGCVSTLVGRLDGMGLDTSDLVEASELVA